VAEAAIVLVAFVAGMATRELWPRFVAWMDAKAMPPKRNLILRTRVAPMPSPSAPAPEEPRFTPAPVRRRVGIAELRRQAEIRSLAPVEHQAQVTANNAKAMESL
jgi:hypothetical protein